MVATTLAPSSLILLMRFTPTKPVPPATKTLLFFKNGLEQRSYRIIGEISAEELVEHLNNLR